MACGGKTWPANVQTLPSHTVTKQSNARVAYIFLEIGSIGSEGSIHECSESAGQRADFSQGGGGGGIFSVKNLLRVAIALDAALSCWTRWEDKGRSAAGGEWLIGRAASRGHTWRHEAHPLLQQKSREDIKLFKMKEDGEVT